MHLICDGEDCVRCYRRLFGVCCIPGLLKERCLRRGDVWRIECKQPWVLKSQMYVRAELALHGAGGGGGVE